MAAFTVNLLGKLANGWEAAGNAAEVLPWHRPASGVERSLAVYDDPWGPFGQRFFAASQLCELRRGQRMDGGPLVAR